MNRTKLIEIRREKYGHDGRAMNRHSERWYRDGYGNQYVLSRTLDGCPPFFEAYGPFPQDHQGLLPRLLVGDREYWGDGWSWRKAECAFCKELDAEIVCPKQPKKEGNHATEM